MGRNRASVPPDVAAVTLNVTVTEPTAAGYITIWPCDQPRPWTSNINFTAGQTIANQITTPVSDLGGACTYITGATAHIIYDATGFAPNPGRFP